jgi:hypothetical protein
MTMTDGMIDLSALRELAASWHGGMSSPLYALASSGAIVEGCVREIEDCIVIAQQYENDPDYAADIPRLRHLLTYVRNRGYRGPVEGWSDIRF